MVKIGIIGGVTTAYGKPSSLITTGKINGVEVVILSRHGKKHETMPTNVPNQANIKALKDQGCTHILATTACGSLREEIKPGDFVFIDQFIDRTTKRASTFYESGKVCHIPMAEPFCPNLRELLKEQAKVLHLPFHEKGTMVTIEGPRFSSRAESAMFRQWGGDVINMSTVPEVVLAREAGIHYAAIAMSTDYDCWRNTYEHVDIEMVLKTFKENAEKVKRLIISTIPHIKMYSTCTCEKDIKGAIIS
jgi:5'-methylthioadenosine phosphorylase